MAKGLASYVFSKAFKSPKSPKMPSERKCPNVPTGGGNSGTTITRSVEASNKLTDIVMRKPFG